MYGIYTAIVHRFLPCLRLTRSIFQDVPRTRLFRYTKSLASLLVALFSLTILPAKAHFQVVYTPKVNFVKTGNIPLKLLFWHPMTNGHVMEMEQPQSVQVFHRDKVLDLTHSVTSTQFSGVDNDATAWNLSVPIKRPGDYVVVVEPTPYYEAAESKYIQQIAKLYLNRNQLATNWSQPQGLEVEILPLVKPYNLLAGTSFSGIVLSQGKPVPFAEIEVEYLVAEPDMQGDFVDSASVISMPGGAITMYTDSLGKFTFAMNKPGYWGFAALDLLPGIKYQNKPLSKDAVIWVQVHDF